jgi:hypothetical protein
MKERQAIRIVDGVAKALLAFIAALALIGWLLFGCAAAGQDYQSPQSIGFHGANGGGQHGVD